MKQVESLRRGLGILQTFSVDQPKLKLQEIAIRTGLAKPTAYRLLRTLLRLDYVRYDPVTTEYQLGPRVMSLGFTAITSLDLRQTAFPYLEELFRKTDQTVNLGILDGIDVVYVERLKKPKSINIDLYVGSRINVYRSSIGRAILAHLKSEKLNGIIEELSHDPEAVDHIGPQGSRLSKELALVRRNGYALNDAEFFRDHRVAGAPVFNAAGEVEGAVNIAVLSGSCSRRDLIKEYVPLLLETTRAISNALGYFGEPANG